MNEQTMDEKDRASIDKAMVWLWLVWGSQLAMLLALVVIAHLLGPRIREQIDIGESFPLGILEILFGIVSAFSLVITWYLRKSCLGGKFRRSLNICVQLAAARKKPAYIVKYQAVIFVTMAIPPSVGIYGFILSLFGAANTVFYSYIIVSALAVIWQRPKKSELITLMQKEQPQMPKKVNLQCYLCGKQIHGKASGDHVPPKQFFPKQVREHEKLNLQLVAAHGKCNNGYKDDEEYFYTSLYPLVDEHNPGMGAAILRDFARRCRKPQTRSLLHETFKSASRTTEGGIILPRGKVEVNIDLWRIQRIGCKVARGALFLSTGRYFPEGNIVDIRMCLEEDDVPEMYQISWKLAASVHGAYPKVFSYKHVVCDEYHHVSMLFWQSFMFCLTIKDSE